MPHTDTHTSISVCLHLSLSRHLLSISSYLFFLLYYRGVIRSLKSRPYIEHTFLHHRSNQPPPAGRLGNRQPIREEIREQRCSAGVHCYITVQTLHPQTHLMLLCNDDSAQKHSTVVLFVCLFFRSVSSSFFFQVCEWLPMEVTTMRENNVRCTSAISHKPDTQSPVRVGGSVRFSF